MRAPRNGVAGIVRAVMDDEDVVAGTLGLGIGTGLGLGVLVGIGVGRRA